MTRTLRYLLALTLAACGSTKVTTTATSTCSDGAQNGDETGVDCGGSCPVCAAPRGNRLLAINLYPSKDGNDTTAFAKGRSAGINSASIGWSWYPELEVAPGVFDTAILDDANSLYAMPGFKVVVMVNPIETDWKAVPPDLAELDFDDPVMIARFKSLLDSVFEHLSDLDIEALLIGNEANSHLMDNPSQWSAYQGLFEAARAHAKTLRPEIKVGVEGMFEDFFADEMQTLNAASDLIALTYYPAKPNPGHWANPDLSVIEEDMANLTRAYAEKDIYMIEHGYPTSDVLGSSEEEQEAFVREAFRVWDLHESRIRMVSFFMLHDFDPVWIHELQEALGVSEHPYYEEILAAYTSIGLRTHAGQDKLAFPALVEEAAARGWEPVSPNN
ncbi:glycosyl hydrolase 53 family protein [Myxococcota bacterium]